MIILILLALVVICVSDWIYRSVSNAYNLSLLVLVFLLVPLPSLNFDMLLPVSFTGIVLWRFGVIGAADIKLAMVLLLGVDSEYILPTFLIIALSGGGLVLVMAMSDKFLETGQLKRGIPYAIPISIGSFVGILASLAVASE